jgi:hypothetical protein
LPEIADNVYNSNPLFFRLNRMNKKIVQGGFQIELPIMYQAFAAGGFYNGYDALNIAPSDTVQNAAFDWKQAYVPVTVDGRTLVRTDSSMAVANFLALYFQQAEMQLADNLGAGIWSNTPGANGIDTIPWAIDNGTVTGPSAYGGLAHGTSPNPWWNGQVGAGGPITFSAMQATFGKCTYGGRHPTIIMCDQTVYNAYIALFSTSGGTTYFERGPGAYDEVLAQGGWTNALFNNIPVLVDSHILGYNGASGTGSHPMYFIDENYFYLMVAQGVDFKLEDFITPVNQDAMVAKLFWMGDLVANNLQTSGVITNAA